MEEFTKEQLEAGRTYITARMLHWEDTKPGQEPIPDQMFTELGRISFDLMKMEAE